MGKYKVSVLSDRHEITIHELDLREPEGKEVLVKIDSSAICTLEQRVYEGIRKLYPFAGGHEASGTVEKVGKKVKTVKPRDKVVIRTLNTCGECHYCRSGNENQCVVSYQASIHEGLRGPGGIAEHMMIDAKNVYKMADDVDLEYAALTEPLACCIHSVNNAHIELGEDVVVMGVGIMGAFHIQLSKLRGARVIACEIDEKRMEVAKKMGADIVLNSTNMEDVKAKVNELTENRGADVVFCTVPSTKVAEDCIHLTGKLGRVIMYTSFHPDNPVPISVNHVHSSEMIITGAVSPRNKDFQTAARLISNKVINLEGLITATVPMMDIEEAYKKALDPGAYRVIIKCDPAVNDYSQSKQQVKTKEMIAS